MKPIRPVLLAALLCVAVGTGLPTGQSNDLQAEMALQAAIKTETVDGNLKSAIEQYLKLADGSHHGVAAKALVRLGRCYEMLGDEQARQAYDRVIRDFADQVDMVATAKARLAALRRPVAVPSLAVRRVWSGSGVNIEGAPSRDGRYLSFANRDTSNVGIRDLATGAVRDLTRNSDSRQYPSDRSLISPDGSTVAYVWKTEGVSVDICRIGTDGLEPRVLYHDDPPNDIKLGAWSPDGTQLAAVLVGTEEKTGVELNRIALISAGDGSTRVLKTLTSRRPGSLGFSADGRFVAYDCPPRDDSKNRDIFLLAVDGSPEIPAVQHPADDQLLGWMPDGKGLIFSSDRTARRGAWFIPVTGGKSAGAPEPILAEMGDVVPLGFTQSGSFFYAVESGGTDAYVATLNPSGSGLLTPPARINESLSGKTQFPLFSPDGRSLAYFLCRQSDQWIFCLRSTETGEEREFPVPADLERLRLPRWAANGQAILVSGVDKQLLHVGFYLINIRTGEYSPILSSNPEASESGGPLTPDGKSLFLARAGLAFADKAGRVMQRELATGIEREIYRASSGEDISNLALSPEGLELAFSAGAPGGISSFDRLGIISIQTGEARELLRLNRHETIRGDGLAWTPAGRNLLFAKAVETSGNNYRLELWRVSPVAPEPQRVGVLAENMAYGDGSSGLRVHPDGMSIAFHAGRQKPEVWMMENYYPAPQRLGDSAPQEVTAEAWVNTSGPGSEPQTILSKGTHTYEGNAYALSLNLKGQVQWGVRHTHTYFGDGGDSSIDGILSDEALRPNTWYHLVGTIYSAKSASIYINGALSKTGPITQTIPSRPGEPLHIGSLLYYGTPRHYFSGLIDGVAVYERVLSPAEIQQRYLAGMYRIKR